MHPHTKFGIPTSNNMRNALGTIILKTRSEVKVTVTRKWYGILHHPKMYYTHQIWNSYLKECRRHAPDSEQFLETRSGQVQGHSDPIMVCLTSSSQVSYTHQIWDSYLKEYKRYALDTIILKTKSEVKISDLKMVRDTLPSQDASTYQIWNSYLKEYRRYARDTKRDSVITICLPKFLMGHNYNLIITGSFYGTRLVYKE